MIIFIYLGKLLDTTTILLWALYYATSHNINMRFTQQKTHEMHHLHKHVNLGLGAVPYDIIFNTKYDQDELENYNNHAINIVLLTLLLCYFVH